MGSRTWIKIYCDKWVSGTLREDAPDVRGVWIDLLALAGSGQGGDTGEIKLANGVGYTDGQIAEILHISKPLWRKAKARLLETERIEISPRGAIRITNWSKYQSEYQRQKPYRESKRDNPTPEPKSPLTNPLEKEIESRKLQPEVTTKSYNATPPLWDDTNNNFNSQGGNPPESPLLGKDETSPISEDRRQKLIALVTEKGMEKVAKSYMASRFNKSYTKQLTEAQGIQLLEYLRRQLFVESLPEAATSSRKERKDTLKARIAALLEKNGRLCSPTEIANGLGLPKQKHYLVNLTLSQNKGKVFVNPQRGLWALKA